MDNLNTFVEFFQALVGVPLFVLVLVNVLKMLKVVKDGDSQTWVKWLTAVIFAGFYLANTFFPEVDLKMIDGYAKLLAEFGNSILALVPIGIWISGSAYDKVKGIPLLGYSLTEAKVKAKKKK